MSQNYKYGKSETEKFTIKGELNNEGTQIHYLDGDKNPCVIDVLRCFKPFKGQPIDLSITCKWDMDLADEFKEDAE